MYRSIKNIRALKTIIEKPLIAAICFGITFVFCSLLNFWSAQPTRFEKCQATITNYKVTEAEPSRFRFTPRYSYDVLIDKNGEVTVGYVHEMKEFYEIGEIIEVWYDEDRDLVWGHSPMMTIKESFVFLVIGCGLLVVPFLYYRRKRGD